MINGEGEKRWCHDDGRGQTSDRNGKGVVTRRQLGKIITVIFNPISR